MFNFKITNIYNFPGVKLIKNSKFEDKRGYIFSLFQKSLEIELIKFTKQKFHHDKIAFRTKNTLTGIHGDKKTWKLVTCLKGSVFQAVVNCDLNSKNFGKSFSFILNDYDCMSVLIPPKYGNAFLALKKENIYFYKLAYRGRYIDQLDQFTYLWNDKKFAINWPIKKPILSTRDQKL